MEITDRQHGLAEESVLQKYGQSDGQSTANASLRVFVLVAAPGLVSQTRTPSDS
jgi:hypothetical protein